MTIGMWLRGLVAVSALSAGAGGALAKAADDQPLPRISADKVADYLHAVIEADRTFYTIHVVERAQSRGGPSVSEKWRTENALPLPAQFLMESGALAALTGSAVRYRLVSLWPINPQNGPATELERKGLEQVIQHPERPATAVVMNGGVREFQAIYADRAVSQSCVACHNADPRSAKKNFALHDVMGGVVITIPLDPSSR